MNRVLPSHIPALVHLLYQRIASNKINIRDFFALLYFCYRGFFHQIIPNWVLWRRNRNQITTYKYQIPSIPVQHLYDLTHELISIIIPTKNAGADFERFLVQIRNQRGVPNIEIIIIDSGSSDQTREIAAQYCDRIESISPLTFNHGLTRNYGATLASGKFLVFTVQDALPGDEFWLYRMICTMETFKLSAVTCRQIPRDDADLFSTFHNAMHYQAVSFLSDYFVSIPPRASIREPALRMLSHLDNVASCYRNEVFDQYKFNTVAIGEDLEIGMRMAHDGHRLGYLYSNPVIHSHSRPDDYWLSRAYIDGKTVTNFFNDPHLYSLKEIQERFARYASLYQFLIDLKMYRGERTNMSTTQVFFHFLKEYGDAKSNAHQVLMNQSLLDENIVLIRQYLPKLRNGASIFAMLTGYSFLFPIISFIQKEGLEPTFDQFVKAGESLLSLHLGALIGILSIQLPDDITIRKMEEKINERGLRV